MKIKDFNIFKWMLILVLIASACGEEDELKLIEPNHRVVYTSEMDFDNQVQVGGEITFGDVSPGVVERTWTFPDGVVDIIGSESDVSSKENIVKAAFQVVGEHEVNLHQVYKGNVYIGTNLQETREIDTTIVVTVLAPIRASVEAYFINKDGTLGDALNLADNAENEVTASRSVRFMRNSEGDPAQFLWEFEGGDPAVVELADEEIDVKYKRMGTFDFNYIAYRSRPFGADTISFKNLIRVIPSTDPVELEQVTERDGKIALVFSREMDGETLNTDDFTVSIMNNGNTLPSQVTAAEIDQTEGNIVLLSVGGVYNDDEVSVSYVPGNLATLDLVKADAFTDEKLVFNTENILPNTNFDYNFENSDTSMWPYLWWGGVWGEFDHEISSAMAHDGNQSLYVNFRPQGGMIISHNDATGDRAKVKLEGGKTYELGMWIYVEEAFYTPGYYPLNPDVFLSDIRFYPDNWAFEIVPVTFDENFPVGEWVYTKGYFTPGAEMEVGFLIRGYNQGSDKNLKFFMDNISISEVQLRP